MEKIINIVKKYTLYIGIILLIICLYLTLATNINETYKGAVLILLLWHITGIIMVYSIKRINKIVILILMVIIIGNLAFTLVPSKICLETTGKLNPQNTYVAYSPTCGYCGKSQNNLEVTVRVYNATHTKKIKLVNVDKETEASKEIREYIRYKGTVVNIDNNQSIIYTKQKDNKPATNKRTNIYNILIKASEDSE